MVFRKSVLGEFSADVCLYLKKADYRVSLPTLRSPHKLCMKYVLMICNKFFAGLVCFQKNIRIRGTYRPIHKLYVMSVMFFLQRCRDTKKSCGGRVSNPELQVARLANNQLHHHDLCNLHIA